MESPSNMHQNTYLVELRGGPGDGSVIDMNHLPELLRFPYRGTPPSIIVSHTTDTRPMYHVYRLSKKNFDVADYKYIGVRQ